ncbi:MAG: sigma-70 family RNA polymerase sigma factor [Planctomycetota bacterium]
MTSSSSANAELLLSQALAGSSECFGRLLHIYRNYLKLLVVTQLERKLQQRVSPSDVVQETFLEANRDFLQFRGTSSGEFCAWLRKILVNNLHRVVEKHVLTAKRDVRREVSLENLATNLEESTARLEAILPDHGTSPSDNAQRHEMEISLANHLAALPADYRDVIVLRHIDGLPFEAVGKRLERSAAAARMLWLRAIKDLRERMDG